MIVSGHRRRASGVKLGYTEFPCLVHEEISRRLGISRKTVFAYLALGKLISPIQQLVRDDILVHHVLGVDEELLVLGADVGLHILQTDVVNIETALDTEFNLCL